MKTTKAEREELREHCSAMAFPRSAITLRLLDDFAELESNLIAAVKAIREIADYDTYNAALLARLADEYLKEHPE